MSAGAASYTSDSCLISKDEKIKFLQMIHNIIRDNVPTTVTFTFKNNLSDPDIVWINKKVEEIEGLCVYDMPTLGISHTFNSSNPNEVILKASTVTRTNRCEFVCDNIRYMINKFDDVIQPSELSEIKLLRSITDYETNKLNTQKLMKSVEELGKSVKELRDVKKLRVEVVKQKRSCWRCWCC